MSDETKDLAKPRMHKGWPPGKKRGPRVRSADVDAAPPPAREAQRSPDAPIHVWLRLRGQEPMEFGCADRSIENGFHVFTFPSKRDPYRTTRKEVAISEVVEIEITEARRYREETPYVGVPIPRILPGEEPVRGVVVTQTGPPRIHSARDNALSRLETGSGPVKLDTLPALTFSDSAG